MARKKSATPAIPTQNLITAPFTIAADSNEYTGNHLGYTFEGMRANADEGHAEIIVPIFKENLYVGDYSIVGHRDIIIERKSKSDLYGTIASDRKNFESRLEIMSDMHDFSAVVVEAEIGDVATNPPPMSGMSPKSLTRTIMAWQVRYNTQWIFCPDRRFAEITTFRLLERYFIDHKNETLNRSKLCVIAFKEGIDARLNGAPVAECPYKINDIKSAIWEQGWRYSDKSIVQHGKEFPDIRVCNGQCYRATIAGKGIGKAEQKLKTDIHNSFLVKKKG